MYDAPNKVTTLKTSAQKCPEYKMAAIKDALTHFEVI